MVQRQNGVLKILIFFQRLDPITEDIDCLIKPDVPAMGNRIVLCQ